MLCHQDAQGSAESTISGKQAVSVASLCALAPLIAAQLSSLFWEFTY